MARLTPRSIGMVIRGAWVIRFSVLSCLFSNVFSIPTAVAHYINNGQILMFKVSKRQYWSAWHDRIFESRAAASKLAKKEQKD